MDIVLRMMVLAHDWWQQVLLQCYGPIVGTWLYFWTVGRLFRLPGTVIFR